VHKSQGSQWDDVVLFDESLAFRTAAPGGLHRHYARGKTLSVVV